MEQYIYPLTKRISIVTGHYGSGKTEFSVSLAMLLSEIGHGFPRLAVIDLDIANPYFRSRERRELLESRGIGVFGSAYRDEITAELPALGAAARGPLEDKGCRVIIDAGGNDSGAIVLNQFSKYFTPDETTMLAVVNFNRYETRSIDAAREHIEAIELVTHLRADGVINNSHLLRETDAEIIRRGHDLSTELCERTDKRLYCDCYPAPIVRRDELNYPHLMPLGMYMRPTWLDVKM